jgi:hypothetical protein
MAVCQSTAVLLIHRYREQARSHRDLCEFESQRTQKKRCHPGQRFLSIRRILSLHHIPQRFQLCLAEQANGVTFNDHPARIRFSDLTRSVGLQPLRQGLKRLTINGQGMACALACHIHSSALSWLMSGQFIQGL